MTFRNRYFDQSALRLASLRSQLDFGVRFRYFTSEQEVDSFVDRARDVMRRVTCQEFLENVIQTKFMDNKLSVDFKFLSGYVCFQGGGRQFADLAVVALNQVFRAGVDPDNPGCTLSNLQREVREDLGELRANLLALLPVGEGNTLSDCYPGLERNKEGLTVLPSGLFVAERQVPSHSLWILRKGRSGLTELSRFLIEPQEALLSEQITLAMLDLQEEVTRALEALEEIE